MNQFFQKKISGLIIISLILFGCTKNDTVSDGDSLQLAPTYSLPIGSIEVVFEDIVRLYKNQLIEIPHHFDSDTISSFFYNDILYFNPVRFDTTVLKGFDFENLTTDLDKITHMIFRTNVDNGIPSACVMQLYFMDGDLTILDSLYHENPLAISSAPTNENGVPTGPHQLRKSDALLSRSQIEMLQDVDFIGMKFIMHINDFSETHTTYLNNQKIWIQFGVTVTLALST